MRRKLAFLLLLFWVCLSEQSGPNVKFQHAVQLTPETFQQSIQQNQVVFVLFYSQNDQKSLLAARVVDNATKQVTSFSKVQVAAVDADQNPLLIQQQEIKKVPFMRIFLRGEPFDYQGAVEEEAIVDYISDFRMIRLLIIPNSSYAGKPAVILTGIDRNSNLQALPLVYDVFPVYLSINKTEFSVEVHWPDNSTLSYSEEGPVTLTKVTHWLDDKTTPVLLSLGSSRIPKRLRQAAKARLPILGLINKGEKTEVNASLAVLKEYCQSANGFVCGYVHKGEYEYPNWISWIGDPQQNTSRLVWVDTHLKKCFIYQSPIEEMTVESISEFVEGVRQGLVKEHIRIPKKAPEADLGDIQVIETKEPQQTISGVENIKNVQEVTETIAEEL